MGVKQMGAIETYSLASVKVTHYRRQPRCKTVIMGCDIHTHAHAQHSF